MQKSYCLLNLLNRSIRVASKALLCALTAMSVLAPLAVAADNKSGGTSQEIVAVTHLASHKEILNLHGIKNLAIGVSPLPVDLSDKVINAASLCNIISKRAEANKVDVDADKASHLLLLTLAPISPVSPLSPHDYSLSLTVRSLKPHSAGEKAALYALKMRATLSGHYPRRINELVERAAIIFWRNYQLAN